jgi:hypothetical protein
VGPPARPRRGAPPRAAPLRGPARARTLTPLPPPAIPARRPARPLQGRGCTCLLLQSHPARGFPPALAQVLSARAVLKAYAPPAAGPGCLRAAARGRALAALCDVSTLNLAPLKRTPAARQLEDIQGRPLGG